MLTQSKKHSYQRFLVGAFLCSKVTDCDSNDSTYTATLIRFSVCNNGVLGKSCSILHLVFAFTVSNLSLNKETTVFNLQNMFRHSHVIFSCK